MAENIEVASLVARLKYQIDKTSLGELEKFNKKLEQYNKKTSKLLSMKDKEASLDLKLARADNARARTALTEQKQATERARTATAQARAEGVQIKNATRMAWLDEKRAAAATRIAQTVKKGEWGSAISTTTMKGIYPDVKQKPTKASGTRLAGMLRDEGRPIKPPQPPKLPQELGMWQKINQQASSLRTSIGAIYATYAAFGAVQAISSMSMEFDAVQTSLTAVTGSMKEGSNQMQFLEQQSLRLGLNLKETSREYIGLYQSAKGIMSGEQIQDLFTSMSEYGKSVGADPYRMKLGLVALQQMASKGKISSEELRRQLAESIPGSVQIFSKALGVTDAQLFEMMQKGELLSEDILPKVAAEYAAAARAGGALDKRLDSADTIMGRMRTRWQLFVKAMGDAGFNKALKYFFETMDAIAKIMIPLASVVGGFFQGLSYTLTAPLRLALGLLEELDTLVGGSIVNSFKEWGDVVGNIVGGITAMALMWKAFKWVRGATMESIRAKTLQVASILVGGVPFAGTGMGGTTPTTPQKGGGGVGPVVTGRGKALANLKGVGKAGLVGAGVDLALTAATTGQIGMRDITGTAGAAMGAAAGAMFGGPVGMMIGSMLGEKIASTIYDVFNEPPAVNIGDVNVNVAGHQLRGVVKDVVEAQRTKEAADYMSGAALAP